MLTPDSTPHLVPVWFVWLENKIFICSGLKSVKLRNIKFNPHIICALEDGVNPLVIEGKYIIYKSKEVFKEVIVLFKSKYDWDITKDEDYDMIIEIIPTNLLMRRKQ